MGIKISSPSDVLFSSADRVIFAGRTRHSIEVDDYLSRIESARSAGKSVFVPTNRPEPSNPDMVSEINARLDRSRSDWPQRSRRSARVAVAREPSVPVVLFASTSEIVDPLEAMIAAADKAQDLGWRPLCISANPMARLFGYRHDPILGQSNGDFSAEVRELREQISDWVVEDHADSVFMSCPAPPCALHPLVPFDHGMSARLISLAVRPASCVLVCHDELGERSAAGRLSDLVAAQLAVSVSCIVATRARIDMQGLVDHECESVVYSGRRRAVDRHKLVIELADPRLGEKIVSHTLGRSVSVRDGVVPCPSTTREIEMRSGVVLDSDAPIGLPGLGLDAYERLSFISRIERTNNVVFPATLLLRRDLSIADMASYTEAVNTR